MIFVNSKLRFLIDRLPVFVMSKMTEQKLHKLNDHSLIYIRSAKATKCDLEERFKKLEEDVAAFQEIATEQALT